MDNRKIRRADIFFLILAINIILTGSYLLFLSNGARQVLLTLGGLLLVAAFTLYLRQKRLFRLYSSLLLLTAITGIFVLGFYTGQNTGYFFHIPIFLFAVFLLGGMNRLPVSILSVVAAIAIVLFTEYFAGNGFLPSPLSPRNSTNLRVWNIIIASLSFSALLGVAVKGNRQFMMMHSNEKQRLRSLIETSEDAILLIDYNFNILLSNSSSLLNKLGKPPEGKTFTGMNILSLIQEAYPGFGSRLKNYLEKARYGTRFKVTGHLQSDSNDLHLEISFNPVTKNGKVTEIAVFISDITSQYLSNVKLRESEQKFRTMLEYTNDWEYWTDKEGNFIYNSPSCEKITGYKPEEFTSESGLLEKIVHADHYDIYKDHINGRLHRHDETEVLEFKITRSDGKVVWVEHICSLVLDEYGTGTGIRVSNRDITARKLVEKEKQSLTRTLDMIYMVSKDGIWDWKVDTGDVYLSASWKSMLGFKPQEITDSFESFTGLLHPGDRDRTLELIQKAIDANQPEYEATFRMRTKEGGYRWILSRGFALSDIEGTKRYAGTHTDITARIMIEEKLKYSEESYRNLVNNQSDLIARVDKNHKFIFVNPAFCRLFGKDQEELLGTNFYKHIHKDDLEPTLNSLGSLSAPPHKCYFEHRVFTKNGWKWLGWLDTAILDEEGKITTITGVGRDITDRKNAESELRKIKEDLEIKVEERTAELKELNIRLKEDLKKRKTMEVELVRKKQFLDLLIDNLPVAVAVQDPSRNFCYTIWNREAENIYGFTRRDVIGKNDFDLFSEKTALSNYSADVEQIKEKKVVEVPMKQIQTSKGDIYIRVIKVPVRNETGDTEALLSIVEDVTQKKTEDDALLSILEKEKELNIIKSRFISMVSHEFRTPLAGISLNVQLLQKLNHERAVEQEIKASRRIKESIQYLTGMLEEVSIIAKDQNEQLIFAPSLVDFESLCRDLALETEYAYKQKRISFKSYIKKRKVIMDRKIIRHIVNNLLSNAMKYSDPQEEVNFDISETDGSGFLIKITDKGIGIPAGEIENITDPFYRAANSADSKGTGLGMSIVKRCVEHHKGNMKISSELGRGTVVEVLLPFQEI